MSTLGVGVLGAVVAWLLGRQRQTRPSEASNNFLITRMRSALVKASSYSPTANEVSSNHNDLSSPQQPQEEALQYRKTLGMLAVILLLTGICSLTLGIVLLFATRRSFSRDPTASKDSIPLYMGQCESSNVKTYNLIAHLVINIIGTVILASSAFAQKICLTPTEDDVLSQIQAGRDVKIGASFPRGVRKATSWLWLLMLISSLPVHLLINAAAGIAIRPIEAVGVWGIRQQDLREFENIRIKLSNGIHFALISIPWGQIEAWTLVSSDECVDLIAEQDLFVLRYRNIAIVLDESSTLNDPSAGWELFGDPELAPRLSPNVSYANASDARSTIIKSSEIARCYVDTYPSSCQVSIRWQPLLITGVTVIFKGLLVSFALRHGHHFRQRLISCLGDLIVVAEEHPELFPLRSDPPKNLKFRARKKGEYTFSEADRIILPTSYMFALALIIAGVSKPQHIGLANGRDEVYGVSLGPMNRDTLLKSPPSSLLAAVMKTNLPQLVLSSWYLVWNNVISRLWVEREWRSFYLHRQKVRVSTTGSKPGRVESPWLQFPYWLTALLMLLSALGHWICSQILTLIEILQSIELDEPLFINYSPVALLCIGLLILIMTFSLTIYAWMRKKVPMPLMEGYAWRVLFCCSDLPRPLPEEGIAWGDVSTTSGKMAGFRDQVEPIQIGQEYPLSD
ncbi:hypothetical protein FDECE_5240 [Fusarium decemcellulare]|nr:hypothetical protein FDECE_5240 [Fusarium decemcellulare]